MVNEYLLFLEMNKTMSGCCMVLCINGLPLHFPSHQLPPSRSERNIPSFCSGCREDTHSLWKGLGEGESTTFPNPVIKLVKNPKGPTLYLDHQRLRTVEGKGENPSEIYRQVGVKKIFGLQALSETMSKKLSDKHISPEHSLINFLAEKEELATLDTFSWD